MSRIFTFDQVTRQKSDVVTGLSRDIAVKLAMARARTRCQDETPAIETVDGRGLIIRNHTRFAEVVIFEGDEHGTQTTAGIAQAA